MASRIELETAFKDACANDQGRFMRDRRMTPYAIAVLMAGQLGTWLRQAEWAFDDKEPKRNATITIRWADRDKHGWTKDNRGVVLECVMYRRVVHTCRLAPGFTAKQFIQWVQHFLIEYPRFYPNLYISTPASEEVCPVE